MKTFFYFILAGLLLFAILRLGGYFAPPGSRVADTINARTTESLVSPQKDPGCPTCQWY